MIGQNHIDAQIVQIVEENVLRVDSDALNLYPYLYEIETSLGNQKSFLLSDIRENAVEQKLVAKYCQEDSNLVIFVYAPIPAPAPELLAVDWSYNSASNTTIDSETI